MLAKQSHFVPDLCIAWESKASAGDARRAIAARKNFRHVKAHSQVVQQLMPGCPPLGALVGISRNPKFDLVI